jgi:hypothetical protein
MRLFVQQLVTSCLRELQSSQIRVQFSDFAFSLQDHAERGSMSRHQHGEITSPADKTLFSCVDFYRRPAQ